MTLAKSKVSAKSKAKQYISNFALIGQQVLFTVTWSLYRLLAHVFWAADERCFVSGHIHLQFVTLFYEIAIPLAMSHKFVYKFDPVNSGREKKNLRMQLGSTGNGSEDRGQGGCNSKRNKYIGSLIYAKNCT